MNGPCQSNPAPFDAVIDHPRGPNHRRAVAAAVAVCATCPLQVRKACYRENRDVPGVVAGLTLEQRIGKPYRLPPTVRASCGRPHGAEQHRRNGEEPCADCREAAREQSAQRRAKQAIAKCGTESGYKRHRRTGTPPCTKCKAAHAAGEKKREKARQERRRKPDRRTEARAENLRELVALGTPLDEVCARLAVSPNALYKWCLNNDLDHLWRALNPPQPEALAKVRRRPKKEAA